MKINNLVVQGFVGIQNLHLENLSNITLFCGYNETGKTSIAQAIGFALRGIPERVQLKKDYSELVNDNCDEAMIALDAGEANCAIRIQRKSGKYDGLPNPDNVPETLHCAVDMFHFVNLDQAGRRRLLFKLGNIRSSITDVAKLVETGGGNTEKLDSIKNMLISGFDAAAKAAKDKASECKKEWERITLQKYGTDKAGKYQPTLVEITTPAAELQKKADALEAEYKRIYGQLNQEQGRAKQLAELEKSIAGLPEDIDAEALESHKTEVENEIRQLQEEIKSAKDALATAKGEQVNTLSCPDCEAILVIENGQLVIWQEPEMDADRIQQLEDDVQINEQAVRLHRDDLAHVTTQLQVIEKAAVKRQAIAEMKSSDSDAANLEILTQQIEILAKDLSAAKEILQIATESEKHNENAKWVAEKAESLHNDVLEWLRLNELLSPGGIPKLLMSKALDPVNVFLKEQADVSGWALCQIDDDMAITYAGRSYSLMSESAQWRASAMLTATITYLSAVNFMVLDRADVLDMNGRAQMVQWLKWLDTEKSMQTIVCATLKNKPDIEGVQTVWLGGEIDE